MAGIIPLMSAPVQVDAANTLQDLRLAVPVAQFDTLELLLNVYEGTSVTVEIWTGMQTESEDGWVKLGSAFTATSAGGSTTSTFTNPLAFIRWKCTFASTCTFMISGVGRST